MSTDLAPYRPPVTSLELAPQAWKLAEKIANTDFVPAALRNRPEAVLACILAGHEAGISPMQALAKIHIIEGRPAMASELQRALVMQHGHDLWYEDVTTTSVTVAGKRRGSERTTKVTWTMDDAKRAGLDQKSNWRKWPRNMLTARATAELCRMLFPDVLAGISYVVEELEDGGAVDGTVDFGPPELVESNGTPPAPPKTARAARAVTRPAPADDPAPAPPSSRGDVPPLPGEEDDDPPVAEPAPSGPIEATAAEAEPEAEEDWPSGDWPTEGPPPADQRRLTGPQMIAIRLADKLGIKGNTAQARAQRLGAISELVGRTIASSNELDPAEMSAILEHLDGLPELGNVDEVSADAPQFSGAGSATSAETTQPARTVRTAPETWNGDQWRDLLAARKVKVTEVIGEAQRLAGLREPKVRVVFLDDLAGSGLAEEVLGFVEDLSLERKK